MELKIIKKNISNQCPFIVAVGRFRNSCLSFDITKIHRFSFERKKHALCFAPNVIHDLINAFRKYSKKEFILLSQLIYLRCVITVISLRPHVFSWILGMYKTFDSKTLNDKRMRVISKSFFNFELEDVLN